MKKLTFLALLSGSLLLGGIGCGDDDDDDGSSAGGDGAADSGAAGSEAGSGGAGGSDGEPDAGGEPVVYDCGGDDAECDLLDANACDDGYGCQFLTPSSGSGAAYAQCSETGDVAEGAECDSDTNPCEPGLHCHSGVCHKYCCKYGAASECPTDQTCVVALEDGEGGTSDVSLCDSCDECNPLTLEGCETGQGCYPIEPEDESEENTGCRLCLDSVGDKEAGESCGNAINECKPGLGCYAEEGGELKCVHFCDLEADPDTCEGDTTCQDSAGSAAMGLQIGICLTR